LKTVVVIVGTRPEVIKMAPVMRAFQKNDVPFIFVNCGQHYDYDMSGQFLEQLNMPRPDCACKISSSSQAVQTARVLTFTEKLLKKNSPSLMLVEGDTNTVLGAALAAVKTSVPVGHVEAGLRSNDLRMPEEHNRRLTDHVSAHLFAPTETARKNLVKENVWGNIHVTGNTVIDAVAQHMPIAQQTSRILERIEFREFALATAHRAENVDDVNTLTGFMEAFEEASIPVVYPMHSRTRKRLKTNRKYVKACRIKNIQILPPLGYLDLLILMNRCRMIITDSGGIQEEATAPQIRKPVLVIRLTTERPEAVEAGFAKVVGTEKKEILKAIDKTINDTNQLPTRSPYGNGDAAQKITEIVKNLLADSTP
jgi:UDP-N-acetylglucosamine 2-epimerase (non-hydrolysing)